MNDDKDIKKTFVKEVISLLAPAANKVKLTVDFGGHVNSVKIFGYKPNQDKNGQFTIRLDDLNHGATQVVVAELPADAATGSINATINFVDAITGQKNKISCEISSSSEKPKSVESVRRNYSIAIAASTMRTAAELSKKEKYRQAEKALKKGIKRSRKMLVNPKDDAANKIIKIAEKYHENIGKYFTSIE